MKSMLAEVKHTMTNILVISNDDLLLSGVARMLGNTHHLIFHQGLPNSEKEMIRKIQTTDCEHVIVDNSLITSGQIQVMALLNCKNKLRVLLMNLHSNEFLIFEKHEVLLKRSEDLVSLLDRSKGVLDIHSLSLFSP
jgi:hypothetical protein